MGANTARNNTHLALVDAELHGVAIQSREGEVVVQHVRGGDACTKKQ